MKMKKIIGSAAAATLALSSVSSYVAFADTMTTPEARAATAVNVTTVTTGSGGNHPEQDATKKGKIDNIGTYAASVSDNVITVKFQKTAAQIAELKSANSWGNGGSGTIAPVYLVINLNGTLDNTADGWTNYGWDETEHEYNVNGNKIMLWLPADGWTNGTKISYTDKDEKKAEFTINYEYGAIAEPVNSVTLGEVSKTGRPNLGANETAEVAFDELYTVTKGANNTITVNYANKTKDEVTAAKPAGVSDPVYFTIATDIPTAVAATGDDTGFKFTSGYTFDVDAHKEFNFESGVIKLWLKATYDTDQVIKFKVGGGTEQTITIKYTYKTATDTSDTSDTSNTSGTTSGSGSTLTPVTPVDPVTPTTSDSNTTSGSTSSTPAATVEEVKGEVTADVKVGETVTVKSDDLGGDVTVATDKEDKALEGTKLELEVTNDKTETTKELNEAVGTNASTEVKATVEAAVKAVEAGNAVTLDISFTKDGKTVQPGKDVTVTVPVPSVVKGADKLFIYHVTDKGLEDITSKCKYDKDKGTVAITNDKFSPYIISKVEIKADSAATSGSSSTTSNGGSTSNPNTGVALAMTPIILAGAAVAVISVKKRS